jgi:hypothetical protein
MVSGMPDKKHDGSLTRRSVVGYTTARKPGSPATPKAPAR